ncbi:MULTISPECIES: RluA family pseudouridine synthase [unclassified Haematospirillum]|uniref:RluA family pseudouridine synthase n=1 Tax=unclassified Haematospirillum TaxID=2622088 RepID=UPI00143B4B92|nr:MULTISPECIES: RluA family pseudouridine synthase [unclassified Haematospirillum]NKD54960.1 RluA family pseudouridine synthase [Haematospirillum sp. H4890]NKD74981.1 RluA family pseudouridine synthase [Haematospirillum sp. H4485]
MSVQLIPVAADEADVRLDRWFRRRWPAVSQGRLEKLLRTGQVRVDGRRAKAGQRLEAGQVVRIPPLPADPADHADAIPPRSAAPAIRPDDEVMILESILYRDDDVLVLNKPPGLAVQGGTNTKVHVDALLDVLRFDSRERPRLVHRLDKDTSGILVLARSARSASALASSFRSRAARKIYWALVVGYPNPSRGSIRAPVAKVPVAGVEKMEVNVEEGQAARTEFAVLDKAGRCVTWLHLEPLTGRTHQLRVHCAYLGTPILGDGKYGGAEAHIQGEGISRKLHLHARALRIPHPSGRGELTIQAPLPRHMASSFEAFGFDEKDVADPFAVLPETTRKKK